MSDSYREHAGKNVMKRGEDMRNKAMAMAMKRKEEYLGARVPKALKERVIRKADEMGIPVSLLMRRLLEQSFPEEGGSDIASGLNESGLNVNGLNENKRSIADVIVPTSAPLSQDKYAGIIGWKSIEVNQDRSCERCKEPLPRGMDASLGFTSSDAGYVIVCQQCKVQLGES